MFGRHEWARVRTLHGFNTVIVVVILMSEVFSFESRLCHGIHYFPH